MNELKIYEELKFNLGIITNDFRSYFSNTIRLRPFTKILKDQNILPEKQIKDVISQVDNSTTIVASIAAGLGKTKSI